MSSAPAIAKPTAAFSAFLQLDGVPGEAQDDKHKDWVELLAYSHQMTQPVSSTRSSAGGAATGRTQHGDFAITKFIDKASPKLYEAVSNGKHFDKAKIEVCRAGGAQLKYMEITLEEVMISNVHVNSHGEQNKDGDVLPTETVHLNYGKIEWTYTQQKRKDGSGGGNVTGKFDLTTGKS
jgi:type VI secretion system secreted protein Hcp